MKLIVSIGISVGILAGIWGQFSGELGLVTWVGFVSWASFYAAGGKADGLFKSVTANLSGVAWALFMVYGAEFLGFQYALGITIAIGACMMCIQSKIGILSFIPGAFLGCSCTFGTDINIVGTIVALIAGNLFGFFSEWGGVFLNKTTINK